MKTCFFASDKYKSQGTQCYIRWGVQNIFPTLIHSSGPQTHAPSFPIKKNLYNTSKVIKYFPSSTWCCAHSSLSVPTISTTIRTRDCAWERPLLCGPPAAGAEVTRAKASRHGCCSADMESHPSHLSNGFVLHSITIIPNVKLQGKISPNILVWKPLFLFSSFHFHFPLNSNQKTWELARA